MNESNGRMLLRDAISSVQKRPGMFLSQRSVRELQVFLAGFCYGLGVARPPDEFPHCPEFPVFRDWLAIRLQNQMKFEWPDMLLAAENSEEAAFDRFFVLWQEFLESPEAQRT